MANVGSLTIQMAADLARLQTDIGKATKMVEGFASNTKKILGAIGVGLSFAFLKNLAKGALDAGDKLSDMSTATGLSIKMLQDLELAAKMSDVPLEKITNTMVKLQVAASKALAGSQKESSIFKRLGIDPSQIKSVDELLDKLMTKISAAETTGEVADVAGLIGTKVTGDFLKLVDSVERSKEIMKSFGLTLSDVDAAKLSEAADIMVALGHYTTLVTRQIVVGMTPALVGIQNWLLKIAGTTKDSKDAWQKVGEVIGDVMITVVQWTIKAVAEIRILINQLNDVASRIRIKRFPGSDIGIPVLDEETDESRQIREAWEYQLRKNAQMSADDIRKSIKSVIPSKKDRKPGAAGEDAEKAAKEADKWAQQIIKFKAEQQKIVAGTDEWRIKIIDINAEYDKLLKEYPKQTAEIEKQRKIKLDQVEFEREINLINIQYKENLAKENAELERSSILNKAKLDVENQLANAQLSLRASRGEDVDLLKIDLDYQKQKADIERQITDLKGKQAGTTGDVYNLYKTQIDALNMQLPILNEIYEINKKIKEEAKLLRTDAMAGMTNGLYKLSDEYTSYGTQMERFTISTFKTMEDAILDFTSGTEFSFKNMVISINRELQRILLQQLLFAPLAKSLGQFTSSYGGGGLLSGFGGMLSTIGGGGNWQSAWDIFSLGGNDAVLGMLAKGGVINRGNLQKFAGGGIFHTPKLFPMANGNIGMLGEAGPEAVMPLTRGPDGKLGVSSSNNSQPVNINIYANDAKSFDEMVRRNPESITSIISKALKGNGQLRHDIRNTR